VDRNSDPVPWITYPAIDFLEPRLRPEMSVFEFGSGNSTLWWAARVSKVTAVEHNASWAAEIGGQMPDTVDLHHVPLERGGDYCRFAQQTGERYDVIVVDGRDRVNCAVHSVGSLTDDGVIVWDNTERSRYRKGLDALAKQGFRRLPLRGPSPINTWASETSILYRSANCLGI
jgi:predicted O-methyltransferase YrrM